MYAVVNGTGGTEITDQIDTRICPIVAKNFRTTDFGPYTTTELRVISTIAPVRNGRSYRVLGFGETIAVSAICTTEHKIRYTTNNTEPTTSSTILGRSIIYNAAVNVPYMTIIDLMFHSAATGFFRPVMTSIRAVGSGDCYWESTDNVCQLSVFDCGPTPANSGTLY